MKELLAVIDMQNDFVFGALGSSDAQAILPAVEERISAARQAGKTVVFTRDTHGEDYLSTQEGKRLPVRHCLKDSEGWQIVGGLQKSGDKVFDKPLFASVELAEYIRRENFGIYRRMHGYLRRFQRAFDEGVFSRNGSERLRKVLRGNFCGGA